MRKQPARKTQGLRFLFRMVSSSSATHGYFELICRHRNVLITILSCGWGWKDRSMREFAGWFAGADESQF
jgi:hypothetical protein